MDDNKLAYQDAEGLLALIPEDPWLGTIKNTSTPALVLSGNLCPLPYPRGSGSSGDKAVIFARNPRTSSGLAILISRQV